MTETMAEILAALPCARTVPDDRPMVWRHRRSGTLLASGGVLTAQQALTEAKAEHPGSTDFQVAGPVLSFVTKYAGRLTYMAEHPAPADPHEAVSVLESDLLSLGMADEDAAALTHAVRLAIDEGFPTPVGAALTQFLASWARA